MREDLHSFTQEVQGSEGPSMVQLSEKSQAIESDADRAKRVLGLIYAYQADRTAYINSQMGDPAQERVRMEYLVRIGWQLEEIVRGEAMVKEECDFILDLAVTIAERNWGALRQLDQRHNPIVSRTFGIRTLIHNVTNRQAA